MHESAHPVCHVAGALICLTTPGEECTVSCLTRPPCRPPALQVPTAGLLNIIGAPHLAADSTYKATYSPSTAADELRNAASAIWQTSQPIRLLPGSKALVRQAAKVLEEAGYPPKSINPTDYWSSGWPRMSLEPKASHEPEEAGLQLPL